MDTPGMILFATKESTDEVWRKSVLANIIND
jgi:hypothetical protein